ncbi:MAG: hypothetical protein JOZ66_18215, partial [Hyphomicrobiales bacterium]|nr:hypothetical protein [Hyphomicrobiales bacterium]
KFEERLAAYKHAQQRELERVKFEVNALMDRTLKLHQKEFDVLPELWGLLVEAHARLIAVTSPLQHFPDLHRMSSDQLDQMFA